MVHFTAPASRPDCSELSRRQFLKTSTFAAASAALPLSGLAAETAVKMPESETLVKTLYDSLSGKQRSAMCFDFDHRLRSAIDNNWFIVKDHRVRDCSKDQQAMIREIFMKMHSEEYVGEVMRQVEDDAGRDGFGECSVAIFGTPDTGKFEFVLTGRHTTRRCDGDSVAGTAFGGPIFYGHASRSFYEKPHHPGNAYWFQAQRANEVYGMMDGRLFRYGDRILTVFRIQLFPHTETPRPMTRGSSSLLWPVICLS